MNKCPLNCTNPDCKVCPYSKQEICDYPYIGTENCPAREIE